MKTHMRMEVEFHADHTPATSTGVNPVLVAGVWSASVSLAPIKETQHPFHRTLGGS